MCIAFPTWKESIIFLFILQAIHQFCNNTKLNGLMNKRKRLAVFINIVLFFSLSLGNAFGSYTTLSLCSSVGLKLLNGLLEPTNDPKESAASTQTKLCSLARVIGQKVENLVGVRDDQITQRKSFPRKVQESTLFLYCRIQHLREYRDDVK